MVKNLTVFQRHSHFNSLAQASLIRRASSIDDWLELPPLEPSLEEPLVDAPSSTVGANPPPRKNLKFSCVFTGFY